MEKTTKLNLLKTKCERCKACVLHETRTNVVFADGNPESASIILIGEAPGENEDKQGRPFVGRAGKLLNEFLESAGISRENDLYIINTVKCRPPKNRVPSNEEKNSCRDFLISQIEFINPKIILLCGATALKSFLPNLPTHAIWNLFQNLTGEGLYDTETSSGRRKIAAKLNKIPISKIRGELIEIEINGKKQIAMPIFHPSYLLRNHSLEPNSPRDLMLKDLIKAKSFSSK